MNTLQLEENQILLLREASMASMSIGMGLTTIRKYSFAQTGYFYNSLYSITTGMERLLKLGKRKRVSSL